MISDEKLEELVEEFFSQSLWGYCFTKEDINMSFNLPHRDVLYIFATFERMVTSTLANSISNVMIELLEKLLNKYGLTISVWSFNTQADFEMEIVQKRNGNED